MKKEKTPITWKHLIITASYLGFIAAFYFLGKQWLFGYTTEEIFNYLDKQIIFAPLILVMMIIMNLAIVPLPGSWLIFIASDYFGPTLGAIYSYLGIIIGSAIAFEIFRYLAKPFIKAYLDHKKIELFKQKLEKAQWFIMFLYMIPLFPIDILTVLLGTIGLARKKFWTIISLGSLIHVLIMSFVSSAVAAPEYMYVLYALTFIAILFFLLQWFYYKTK